MEGTLSKILNAVDPSTVSGCWDFSEGNLILGLLIKFQIHKLVRRHVTVDELLHTII